jgi:hypothetical protein
VAVSGYPTEEAAPVASESLRVWLFRPLYISARSRLSLLSLLLPVSVLSLSLSLASLLPSRSSLACGREEDSRLRGRTVWLSHGVGVGVCCDLSDWSLAATDRTMLLSFSAGMVLAIWLGTRITSGVSYQYREHCHLCWCPDPRERCMSGSIVIRTP